MGGTDDARRVLLPAAPINEMGISVFSTGQLVDPFRISELHRRFADEFPVVERQMPVVGMDNSEFVGAPPIMLPGDLGAPPRWWFIEESGERLLQAQERFLGWNWRRRARATSYPGFEKALDGASEYFRTISDFQLEHDQEVPSLTSAQVFYDNMIIMKPDGGEQRRVETVFRHWRSLEPRPAIGWNVNWLEPMNPENSEDRSVVAITMALGATIEPNHPEPRPVLKLAFNAVTGTVAWETLRSFALKAHDHISERFKSLLTDEILAEFEDG
jgi:uncharacterized protein (TIGR04255 family)